MPRTVAPRPALPLRTSVTYWPASLKRTQVGAARSSSVAWQEKRSGPFSVLDSSSGSSSRVGLGLTVATGSSWPTFFSQACFQYSEQAVPQPPCAPPSQRAPVRWTACSIRRMRPFSMVSQSLCATLCTVIRCPQNLSISGMNGRLSSSPRSSRVARISASLRTSTRSPTRSSITLSP